MFPQDLLTDATKHSDGKVLFYWRNMTTKNPTWTHGFLPPLKTIGYHYWVGVYNQKELKLSLLLYVSI